jgi:hypothetical protein
MPPLSEVLGTSMKGFVPMEQAPPLPSPVAPPGQTPALKSNPSIRCPLPPINANPDDLRQFDDGNSAIPRRRVLPLPANNGLGGTTINNTSVISEAGSSSSTPSLSAKSVSYKTALINSGQNSSSVITMAKSFQLISCIANAPCDLRLYGSAQAQAADAARATDAPLAAELLNNLITNVVFDTTPFSWQWQNRVGVNSNNPQTTAVYITVINTASAQAVIQITLTYLPLES